MIRKPFAGRLLAACALMLITVACSDPAVKKVQLLEDGNRLMGEGKHPEAVIAYKNAIKLDQKYGEARFQLARALEKQGNGGADAEYVRAADGLPDHFDAQLQAARALMKMRRFDEAQKRADRALALNPRSADAQMIKAYALAGLKDMDGALKEMEAAAQASPGDHRAYANLGLLYAKGGKPEEAEAAFKQAILTNPNAAEPKLALAYFYYSTRRTADAERILDEVLRSDPLNVGANRMVAYFHLGAGRAAEAEAPLRRLVDLKDAQAALTLGDLYAGTGRSAEARTIFESLLAANPSRDMVVARLATLDYQEGRKAEAHARLDRRLAQPTPAVELLVLKAQFLSVDGRRTEALEAARKAVGANAKSSQAHYWLGIAEEQNQNNVAAIAAHTEALKLEPGMNVARIAISRVMAAEGRSQEALQHAQAVQKAVPGNPDARLAVVRALLQKGQIAEAETQVGPLTLQNPKSATAHAMHGQVLLAKGDRAGAARHFDAALAIDPADADALGGRIVVDLQGKSPDDARRRVTQALAKHPNDGAVLMTAARLEATDNKPEAAEKYLRTAIQVDPTNLAAYGMLARLYLKLNRLEEGKRELQHIAANQKDAVAARTMIGMIEQLQGKPDDAIKTYEEVLKDNSKAPLAANNLAYLYADRNDRLDDAVRLAQSAKLQMPDSHEISDTLGWVYIKKGLPQAAIPPLEFSVSKSPKNAEYLYHLGLAYAKAGQAEKAQKALGDALRIKPDFEGAQDARQTLASLK